jgi:Tol biopolymer transport system component
MLTVVFVAAMTAGLFVAPRAAFAAPGDTSLASMNSSGVVGNHQSRGAAISADGRYVAFASHATNLVPGGSTEFQGIYLRDRDAGTTVRVSVDPAGNPFDLASWPTVSDNGRWVAFSSNQGRDIYLRDVVAATTVRVTRPPDGGPNDDYSWEPSISGDGKWVAFHSKSSRLVPGDTNGLRDVYLWNRLSHAFTRVTMGWDGSQPDGESYGYSISRDGAFVGFTSEATNLVEGDTNAARDAFVWERATGIILRVSTDSGDNQVAGGGSDPWISTNGRYVAFDSYDGSLVPDDTNQGSDVFVKDLATGEVTRVSVSSTGGQSEHLHNNSSPSMSYDGRYVAFNSDAWNLVPGPDTTSNFIYVRDRLRHQTIRVSDASGGVANPRPSYDGEIAGGGGHVVFATTGTLVPEDTNTDFTDGMDVYVHQFALPVTVTKTVADAQPFAGKSDHYDITLSNPNALAVSVGLIRDHLPAGFVYTPGSSTGVTGKDPKASKSGITWKGPFTVPASSKVVLGFDVTVSVTPGIYYNSAFSFASNAFVEQSGRTAKLQVMG